jgi:hypothetical protein
MHMFASTAWGQTHCRCQLDTTSADFGMDYPEHIEHVAAAVVAALNLTEEWAATLQLAGGHVNVATMPTEQGARDLAARDDRIGLQRRSVGPWAPVGLEGETP